MTNQAPWHGYKFSPEGGRASYYYPYYTIVRMYGVRHGTEWDLLTTGNTGIQRNHLSKWYMVYKDEQDFGVHLDPFLRDGKRIQRLERFITRTRDNLLARLRIDPSHLTSGDLAALIEQYYREYEQLVVTAGLLRYLDRAVVGRLQSDVPESSNVDEILRLAAISERETFPLQEERAVLKLALEAKGKGWSVDGPEVTTGLAGIAKAFAHGTLGYFDEQPKSLEEYRTALARVLQSDPEHLQRELDTRRAADHQQRSEVIGRLNATLQQVAELAATSSYLKDYYKSSINAVQFAAEPAFTAVGHALGYPPAFVKDLSPEEVVAALRGGEEIDADHVNARIEQNALIRVGDHLTLLIGDEAAAFEREYLLVERRASDEFRGRVASPGKARGTARIVLSPKDFPKMQQGNILVVTNTSPDFVPIMRKAAAIAAEEGGITAHVSVVSREFGIPCAVGITDVTSLIHDGDLVEVDAEQGIVRVVRRA